MKYVYDIIVIKGIVVELKVSFHVLHITKMHSLLKTFFSILGAITFQQALASKYHLRWMPRFGDLRSTRPICIRTTPDMQRP